MCFDMVVRVTESVFTTSKVSFASIAAFRGGSLSVFDSFLPYSGMVPGASLYSGNTNAWSKSV